MSFQNKVVLITGSGSGMGEATAILFAEKGADVVLVDLNEETANDTAEKCRQFGNRVLVLKADISKDNEAKNAIEKTIEEFGKLDVLVNNAGIVREENLLSEDIMETYNLIMNTNLRSVVLVTSVATPHLIKTKGCIVNTSSILTKAIHLGSNIPTYIISKVGVDCFTRLSALRLAPFGVRVNAINPGPVYTNILKHSGMDSTIDQFIKLTALERCSEPHEIAELILFLASDKAKSITGGNYAIDNGMSLM